MIHDSPKKTFSPHYDIIFVTLLRSYSTHDCSVYIWSEVAFSMFPMVCISCSTVLPYAAVSCDLSSARRPACASICVRDFPQKSPWTWTWPSINCSSLECLADSLFLYEPNVFSLAVSTTLQEKVQKLIKRLLEFDGKRLVISSWPYGRILYEIAYKHKVTHHTVSF